MKVLRRTAAIGLAAAMALTAAACGEESGGGGDVKEITFVAAKYSDQTEPYWQGLIDKFEKENAGYKVKLEVISWDDIDGHVQNLVLNDKQPDLLNLNKYSDFADDDLLHPAVDVLNEDVIKDFVPSFAESSKLGDEQYGLPLIASARLLFYNKDLFKDAGVKEPPATWADLKSAAEKIKAKGAIGYGMPLGPEEAQAEFQLWINGNGGHWVDDAGKWTIDSPENLETLEFMKGLVDAKLTQPNPAKTDRADVFNAFAEGKIGMVYGHPQLQGIIKDQGGKIDYGIVPNPANEGHESSTLGVQDFLMAFKRDGNEEALNKFLAFFYQEENYVEFIKTEGFLPTTVSAGEALADEPNLKPFIEVLPTAKFFPVTDPQWTAVDSAVKQNLGKAVQGTDPKLVLEQLQKETEG